MNVHQIYCSFLTKIPLIVIHFSDLTVAQFFWGHSTILLYDDIWWWNMYDHSKHVFKFYLLYCTLSSSIRRASFHSGKMFIWWTGYIQACFFTVFDRNSVFLNLCQDHFSGFFLVYNKGFLQKNMIFRLIFLGSIPCLVISYRRNKFNMVHNTLHIVY